MTNITAFVSVFLITNQVASVMPTPEQRIETYVISERHVVWYYVGDKQFVSTNDHQIAIERRRFLAVRTEKWIEVPAVPVPMLPPMPNINGPNK